MRYKRREWDFLPSPSSGQAGMVGSAHTRGWHEYEGGWTTQRVFIQKQLQVREGKNKVLATWIRDVITHALCHQAPSIDFFAHGCARVLMSARSRSSHVLAVSSSFKNVLCSLPANVFTEYTTGAPIGSVLPASTAAQAFGRDLLVVVLHLLSNPSCRSEEESS